MSKEIERKYLVRNDDWRAGAVGVPIRQGYLSSDPRAVVRVRIEGTRGLLTVKGPSSGITRDEFEYPVPLEDAWEMLDRLCDGRIVHKTRYRVTAGARVWMVDEFHAGNEGLVLAEVELESEGEVVEPPDWAGDEVSSDPRYTNVALAKRPWGEWRGAEP